jgi:predicted RNA-binding protein with PUA-like domain
MNHWLLKTEPETYAWQQLGSTPEPWNGVRNYQARNFMQQMQVNDLAFVYHSGKERQIMGIARVVRTAYPDAEDTRFAVVDVVHERPLPQPVTLAALKAHPDLQDLLLIKQSRLSVMPISADAWQMILALTIS